MDHVVYVQVYLEDVKHYQELNEVFANYFPHDPPARAVLGVAQVPESPVQITAVAVRDLRDKQPVSLPGFSQNKAYSPGMLTYDRLFVSSIPAGDFAGKAVPKEPAEQVNMALDQLNSVVQASGLTLANMVFVNPYLTAEVPMRVMNEQYARRFEFGNTPARATIQVSSLPEAAQITYTGVAVRDLSQRRSIRPKNMPPSPTASPCVFAGDTLYCSAKSGFIPGAEWRRVRGFDEGPDPPDHAQPPRQSRGSRHEFRSGGLHYDLPGQSEGTVAICHCLPKIFQGIVGFTNDSSAASRQPNGSPTKTTTTPIWSKCHSSPCVDEAAQRCVLCRRCNLNRDF